MPAFGLKPSIDLLLSGALPPNERLGGEDRTAVGILRHPVNPDGVAEKLVLPSQSGEIVRRRGVDQPRGDAWRRLAAFGGLFL